MKTPLTLISLGLILSIGGCTKAAAAGEEPTGQAASAMKEGDGCGGCADSMAESATTHEEDTLAKGIKLEAFTPISAILADFEGYEGKRVKVKGEAVGVCAKRGCWVTLKSEKDNDKALRVKVEDGEIVFPVTVKGHEVVAEGVVEKVVIPLETLREALQKQAEAKGETFDPATVTEPRINWQLKGLGAEWES